MEASGVPAPVRWIQARVLVCFLLGLLGLDGLVRLHICRWETYDPNDYLERLRRCQGRAWDLVVLGGSPVSEGVNSDLLHPLVWRGHLLHRVYNLGLPGGTTTEFWHGLRHGVTAPPRLVVYGITASDLNDNRNESAGPSQLMDLNDLERWMEERPDSRDWVARQYVWASLERCWSLYRYRNAIRLWAAHRVDEVFPGLFPEAAQEARSNLAYCDALARGHGFAPQPRFHLKRYSACKENGIPVAPFCFLGGYRIGHHLDCVHRIRAWAKRHGADLVLVDMPVSADLEANHAGAFALYRTVLRELEDRHGYLVLHGDRDAVGLTDDHFADLIHLNAWGGERFSHWLRVALSHAGFLG
jgi:hypothetical protein